MGSTTQTGLEGRGTLREIAVEDVENLLLSGHCGIGGDEALEHGPVDVEGAHFYLGGGDAGVEEERAEVFATLPGQGCEPARCTLGRGGGSDDYRVKASGLPELRDEGFDGLAGGVGIVVKPRPALAELGSALYHCHTVRHGRLGSEGGGTDEYQGGCCNCLVIMRGQCVHLAGSGDSDIVGIDGRGNLLWLCQWLIIE